MTHTHSSAPAVGTQLMILFCFRWEALRSAHNPTQAGMPIDDTARNSYSRSIHRSAYAHAMLSSSALHGSAARVRYTPCTRAEPERPRRRGTPVPARAGIAPAGSEGSPPCREPSFEQRTPEGDERVRCATQCGPNASAALRTPASLR